jgi:hypothetical protein
MLPEAVARGKIAASIRRCLHPPGVAVLARRAFLDEAHTCNLGGA